MLVTFWVCNRNLSFFLILIRLVYKAGHVTDVFNLKYLKKLNFNETNAIMRTIFFGCSAQLELGQLKKPNQIDEKTYL